MTLFKGRYIIALLLALIGIGFWSGVLHVEHDKLRCFASKSWTYGDWHVLWAVGHVQLRYRPASYDCDPSWKLDPAQYKTQDGIIVPTQN